MKIEINEPQWYWQIGNRGNQEDALFPTEYDGLHPFFVICDGVGGNDCGEVASNLVCETLGQFLSASYEQFGNLDVSTFEEALTYAWEKLYDSRTISRSMATTLAFAAMTGDGVFVAHIGDSRIYQVRPSKGILFRTEDHSLVNELLKRHSITPEEAVRHPKRNVITRCMNVRKEARDYDEAAIDIIRDVEAGDIFLLCTDGVYDKAGDEGITEILTQEADLKEKRDRLAERTRFSKDNNTAFLIEIKAVEKEERDREGNSAFETHVSSQGASSMFGQLEAMVLGVLGKLFKGE